MRLDMLVERWGDSYLGFVRELPGCQVEATDLDALVEAAPRVIASHLDWLDRRGLPSPAYGTIDVGIRELRDALPGGRGPCFKADRQAPSPEAIDEALQIGEAALAELVELYRLALPAWRAASTRPAGWSPDEMLHHVAELDVWYASRLSADGRLEVDLPADPVVAVLVAGRTFASTVRSIPVEQRGTVVEHDGEEWTLAKALRRRTGHLREHALQLAAWISLGQ
ncbi:type II toxin-antitoxin system HicB family antitoxin [Thermomicrobiaceae bacterium CFH 74404]|uniref:Type II toxin-antitoxin system HicB family antitoxin n=1 Tax=Thermalbibacter longus TaxID=2951981 RepID=A0AA42BA80_9BACT|nr:type II toxin-antitoxin system HicB family antitoxin [Thermalbibacter longus]MCM8748200.1 type II toxin-antitoxin system HicB family antitoxin [Thermalbibacter longus]